VLAELDLLPGALLARMSGSGATCFALFATREQAETGAQILREQHPGWWVEAAALLGK
jgi:4-diphosphocytidyl-2-C-methyl-D-erythritol kinase